MTVEMNVGEEAILYKPGLFETIEHAWWHYFVWLVACFVVVEVFNRIVFGHNIVETLREKPHHTEATVKFKKYKRF